MVATSWPTEEVRCAPSLDAGTHDTLQSKSGSKTTIPKDPNQDTSRSGQGSAGANEASPVSFFLVELITTAHVPLDAT